MLESWYGDRVMPWTIPLAWLFHLVSRLRRQLYRLGIFETHQPGLPVIVVGNITVGGSGKTPVVIQLVKELRALGYRPGVISRGYGARLGEPRLLSPAARPEEVGDEPVLIAREAKCPVAVFPRRVQAVELLQRETDVDVVISDDGLQHYALGRLVEIAVIDGERGLGNGRLLPAGPLREPAARLDEVDLVIRNGGSSAGHGDHAMTLEPRALVNLASGEERPLEWGRQQRWQAVAGIGNPARFGTTLESLGYVAELHAFRDHHEFSPADFRPFGTQPVLMTAKDAVKCQSFAADNWWYLDVVARFEQELGRMVSDLLEHKQSLAVS